MASIPSVGIVQSESAGAIQLGQVSARDPHGHEIDPQRSLQISLAPLGGPAPANGRVPVALHRPARIGPVEEVETRARGIRDHDLGAARDRFDQDVRQMAGRRTIEPVGESGIRFVGRILQQTDDGAWCESGQGLSNVLGFEQRFADEARGAEVGVLPDESVEPAETARAISGVEAIERIEEPGLPSVHAARRCARQPQRHSQYGKTEGCPSSCSPAGSRRRCVLEHPFSPGSMRLDILIRVDLHS